MDVNTTIRELWPTGLKIREIGEKVGLSEKSVSHRAYGVLGLPRRIPSRLHAEGGGWTPEKVDMLVRMWGQKMSTAMIGEETGMGKNAVIGKAHRMGLPARAPQWTEAQKEHRKRRRKGLPSGFVRRPKKRPPPKKRVLPPTPPPSPQASVGVHICDLESHHCREVMGYGPDALARYCGERVRTRRDRFGKLVHDSFCIRHAEVNYAK